MVNSISSADVVTAAHSDQTQPVGPSIDPAEQAFYSRLATTWWDPNGPFWPLHRLNAVRVPYISDALCRHFERDRTTAQPLAGLSLLDIGCGGGILTVALARLGARVHGIDVVHRNIITARDHVRDQHLPVTYTTESAETLAQTGATYDAVLSMEVVEHVADLHSFVSSICSLTAQKGILFIATINRTLRSWMFAIVGAEYLLGWLPRGTHQWRRFPKPEEITALIAVEGFAKSHQTGVAVNPFSRTMRHSSSLAVNYMLAATRQQRKA